MIAFAKKILSAESTSNPGDKFLAMLPAIREQGRIASRGMRPDAREDFIAEVVANSFCAFQRLVERGRAHLAFPSALAMYAIRQVRAGRRVGSKMNINDITSKHCQVFKGAIVERLDQWSDEDGDWREVLVEDHRAGPAETASARIDFASWLRLLGRRKAKIARALAKGERTKHVAKLFGLSEGRVSQLRNEFRDSWDAFQGELVAA